MANVEVGKQTITDVTTMTATPTGGSQRTLAAHLATLPDSQITATGSTTARTLAARFADTVNVKDFGAVGDGVADDTAAVDAWATAVAAGSVGYVPQGTYLVSHGLRFTAPVRIRSDSGTRIQLTASASYVLEFDGTGGGGGWMYGPEVVGGVILDALGNAAVGLSLKGVVNGTFDDVRVTNVTGAGFHLGWAQLCHFRNPTVSRNIEAFTTTPVNGILADTASSSANTFVNPTIEKVSGSGIKLVGLINSLFLNGTSEGNDIGIECGDTGSSGLSCVGNTFVGMDLEENATSDVVVRSMGRANDFIGLHAGYTSPEVQVLGGLGNRFFGGITGGFNFDANSAYNAVFGTNLLNTPAGGGYPGHTATLTDAGTLNTIESVWNYSDSSVASTAMVGANRSRNYTPAGGAAVVVDRIYGDHAIVTAASTVSNFYMDPPVNGVAGQSLTVTVRNASGGALTVVWAGAAFKTSTWTSPADGYSRSVTFRFDGNVWVQVGLQDVDVPN